MCAICRLELPPAESHRIPTMPRVPSRRLRRYAQQHCLPWYWSYNNISSRRLLFLICVLFRNTTIHLLKKARKFMWRGRRWTQEFIYNIEEEQETRVSLHTAGTHVGLLHRHRDVVDTDNVAMPSLTPWCCRRRRCYFSRVSLTCRCVIV